MAACCVFFHSFSSPSIFSSRHLPFHLPVGPSICPSLNNLCLPRLQALAHILSFSILVWYLRPSPCLMGGNLSPTRNSLRLSGEGFLGWLLLSLPSVRFRCGLLPSSSPAYPDFSSLTVCAQHGHSTCLTLQVSPDIQLSRVMDGIENILRKLWPRERKLKIYPSVSVFSGFPDGASGKEPTCQGRKYQRHRLHPWVGKIPWRRKWQPTSVFLPGESHGQRSLAGYSWWGCKESDTTEPLTLSLVVWRLRLLASTAGGTNSTPSLGTKIPACCKAQPKRKKELYKIKQIT